MTFGSLDFLGPFVIEIVAQVDDEQRREGVRARAPLLAFVPANDLPRGPRVYCCRSE
jgi:hypothetical protein